MAKIILHVGMHKTGTTSIQGSFRDFEDDDFCYAHLGKSPNHSYALQAISMPNPSENRMLRQVIGSEEEITAFVRQTKAELRAAIAKAGNRTLIISGEGISISSEKQIQRLSRMFRNLGCEVDVWAYIRSPQAYMSSAFQQRLKGNGFREFAVEAVYPRYRKRFEKFDAFFGKDHVHLRKFDPANFPQGDVVRDFCQQLGIKEGNVEIVRKNETLSRAVTSLLYQYNKFKAGVEERPGAKMLYKSVINQLTDIDDTKFRLSPMLVDPVVEANAEDVAWMEDRLGQPLREAADEDRPTDIRSEDDLLVPVPQAIERLTQMLKDAGQEIPEDVAGNAAALLHMVTMITPRGRNANQNIRRAAAGKAAGPRRNNRPPVAASVQAPRGTPLTSSPRPLINADKGIIVMWSPKSACTTTYVWFAHVSGFLEQVRSYANWPHKHRQEVFERSDDYRNAVNSDLSAARTIKIIRDPYSRAVSIYRHAVQTHFADKALAFYKKEELSFDTGVSFQQFLDFVSTLDLSAVDIHFRPQYHPYENSRKISHLINISKQDLFEGINAFEREAGWEETDFHAFDWLHGLEGKRKAKQESMEGDALDKVPFTRQQVKEGLFPSYAQLLTPETKSKIESIYKADFDAYRDFL